MYSENFLIDDCGQSEIIKDVSAVSPNIDTSVLSETLIVKPVNLSDLPTFVISSNQMDSIWVTDFESEEEKESFDAIKSSVHEISHEEVVGLGTLSAHFEQLHQIIELAMNITTDGQGSFNLDYICFVGEDFLGTVTESFYLALLDVLAFHELLDLLVQV